MGTNSGAMSGDGKTDTKANASTTRPPRLYVKGAFVTFRRSNANQRNHTAILQIDGVNSKDDVDFYLGKRVAYIFKAKRARVKYSAMNTKDNKHTSRFRVLWGKIQRAHGNNGNEYSVLPLPHEQNNRGTII